MIHFNVRIAGLIVGIDALHPAMQRLCAAYCCEDTPQLSVHMTPEDIVREREKAAREDAFEGLPARNFTDTELEYTAIYRKIAEQLPALRRWVFHGSAVAVDGKAYLFTAKSGTGKSTHTALWRQLFGARAVMVNDDKPILYADDAGKIWVCGTPWDGKHHRSTPVDVPLCGLAVLNRGAENRMETVPAAQVWPMLLQQSYRPRDAVALRQTMQLLDVLCAAVPTYTLYCNPTPQAALVAYEKMSGEALTL